MWPFTRKKPAPVAVLEASGKPMVVNPTPVQRSERAAARIERLNEAIAAWEIREHPVKDAKLRTLRAELARLGG